ncbi:MAG: aminoacyl-tRNA hydrolase [Oscillospiraceae bacterium]|nr:aminoacyl-tRNA hydrolase [Oscillospiraceae bacterium]MDD7354474.1 aminoacyl-tRNA hydrolase [Oscillospiraceae bacterium]MDY3938367.1 aminoacyl-tRNA hydrolase [Oscillospiraceae bacterium]
MAFFKRKKEESFSSPVFGKVEYIIAGLGNPGKQYELSRHNAGFLCIDILANRYSFKTDRIKFNALCADVMISSKRCLVMRPQTYMNLSGDAVKAAADFYKIPSDHIIIIYDDIDLPVGALRIRRKGSAGGHNGIKSIIAQLGTDEFPRLKIGVGAKPDPDYDLKDYVLGTFSKADQEILKTTMAKACDGVEIIVSGDVDKAMATCQITKKQ